MEVVAKKGIVFVFYRGLRSVMAANLIPYHFDIIGGGMLQAILFRRMLRPVADDELHDIRDLSRDVGLDSSQTLTAASYLTSGTRGIFKEAQSMTRRHGAWSLMSYTYMTAMQVVPGFCNFLGGRLFLFLALGPSQVRERQIRRRKELLSLYVLNKREKEEASADELE